MGWCRQKLKLTFVATLRSPGAERTCPFRLALHVLEGAGMDNKHNFAKEVVKVPCGVNTGRVCFAMRLMGSKWSTARSTFE